MSERLNFSTDRTVVHSAYKNCIYMNFVADQKRLTTLLRSKENKVLSSEVGV